MRISTAVRPVLGAVVGGTPAITADDFEDLMSQVVEKVLRRLASGAEILDLEAYAKQAARHAFYDRVRRRGPILLLEPGTSRAHPTHGSIASPQLSRRSHSRTSSSPARTLSGTGR